MTHWNKISQIQNKILDKHFTEYIDDNVFLFPLLEYGGKIQSLLDGELTLTNISTNHKNAPIQCASYVKLFKQKRPVTDELSIMSSFFETHSNYLMSGL